MKVAGSRMRDLVGRAALFSAYSGTVRRGAVPLKSPANDNYAYRSDTLILDVEMHADLRGMYAQASKLEASFGSMLLESVQNILESENNGISFGFGFAGGKASLDSIGAHIQDRSRHVVDSLSALIGTESVNLVVARALHLTGAMIANAEKDENGALTDHGHMTAKIGELFVQHIYDYDDGKTLATAMSFAQNTKVKDKGGKAIDYFSLQGTLGSFDKDGYTHPTLGQGDITIENNPAELAKAHRDAATPQTFETHHDIKPTFLYYSNIDTKALREAIPSSPSSWVKSIGTTVAETLGFGTFGETEEEKSKRLEKERIEKAVEEFERNHAQYRKEQEKAKKAKYQALNQIDDEVMAYDEAKDYELAFNKQRRIAIDISIYELKQREGLSTKEAFKALMPLIIKVEQDALLVEPEKSPLKKKAAITGLIDEEEVVFFLLLASGALAKYFGDRLKEEFPIHENKGSILSTPAQEPKPDLEQFPAHEDKGSTLSTPQHRGEADVEGFDLTPDWLRDLNILYSVKVDKDGNMDLKGFDISDHEGGKHKGHTEERHVGKSNSWLTERLHREQNIKASTTFKDKKAANEIIKEVLEENKAHIGKWMKKERVGSIKRFDYEFDTDIGSGIRREDRSLEPRTKARIVLEKTSKNEFKIKTAYPID